MDEGFARSAHRQRMGTPRGAQVTSAAAMGFGFLDPAHPMEQALQDAVEYVYAVNVANGWFEEDRTFGDEVSLLHSEASEMLEEFRHHRMETFNDPDQGGKPIGMPSEVADVFIRLLDVCKRHDINLFNEFVNKMLFNETRGHRHGGKAL